MVVKCLFLPWDVVQMEELARATTGWNTTASEMLKAAERMVTLARLFNLREGFTAKDDKITERFFEAFTDGSLDGVGVPAEQAARGVKDHYEMMGWRR